jgi:DNA-binding NarL/FixJ family response regulator
MIFIVDDSKALRERLTKLLSEIEGAEVVGQARNFDEAVAGIRDLKPCVVILDIQMPGGSGIEVLKTIRRQSRSPFVLMLTNHAFSEYRERCMELGADYFLDKTRDFDQVIEIVKGLVGQCEEERN